MRITHITTLDIVRFFASLAVILFHYTAQDFHTALSPVTQYGFLGVQLFFMISGFVIALSLNTANSPRRFLLNRFIRLYPAFIICMTITVVYVKEFSNFPPYSIKEITLNATMLGEVLRVRLINGAYWSLSVEWLFYFMVAIVLATIGTRRLIWFLWTWLALSAVQIFFDLGYLKLALALRYTPYFVAGASFYLIARKESPLLPLSLLCAISFPVSVYWAIKRADDYQNIANLNPLIIALVIAVFYALLARLSKFDSYFFSFKTIFALAGRASYPLYLIHETIGVDILERGRMAGLSDEMLIPALIISMTAIAVVISEWIERPAIRLFKRSFSTKRIAQPAS